MPAVKTQPKSLLGKKHPKAKVDADTATARVERASKREGRSARVRDEVARAKLPGNGSAAAAALTDPNAPLTESQRAFAKHWASGESIVAAAAKAGYATPEFGYRLCRMPKILNLYQEEKRLYAEVSQMTRKRVIDGMLEGIEMARMCEEPASFIGGWREIGKICGFYEPVTIKHEVSHSGKVIMERLDSMSNEDLFKLIEERAKAITQGDEDDKLGGGT